ncbi:hypothetical protein ACFSLT_20830 [Novosphingobium resinovorum]
MSRAARRSTGSEYRIDRVEDLSVLREVVADAALVRTVGSREVTKRIGGIAEVLVLLGQRIADAQRIARLARCNQRRVQPSYVIGLRRLPRQDGERIVRPRIARIGLKDRLVMRARLLDPCGKAARRRKVVSVFEIVRIARYRCSERGKRGLMIAQPRQHATDRVESARIVGAQRHGLPGGLGSLPVAPQQDQQPGKLRNMLRPRPRATAASSSGTARAIWPASAVATPSRKKPVGSSGRAFARAAAAAPAPCRSPCRNASLACDSSVMRKDGRGKEYTRKRL